MLPMKASSFAERLNLSLDKEGFPPKNRGRIQLLAEMVGLTHRGASKWINGESEPPAKKITSLAKKLNVSEKWLLVGEGSMLEDHSESINKEQTFLIDVPIYTLESLLSKKRIIQKQLQCTVSHTNGHFGIILDTEAMSPRFPRDSIIIFDSSKAKDGDFVLIDYNNFPSPIFRQLLIVGNNSYLNAHNPKFDRLVLNDSKRIIGKLVQAILLFD
jgi:SOS-response transcriptional repressor LexA